MDPAIGCLILLGVTGPAVYYRIDSFGGNRYGRRHNLRLFKLYTR